jgi:hypothetical protein
MRKLINSKVLLIIAMISFFTACNENDNEAVLKNESVIVDNNLHTNTAVNNYTITAVKIEGNLLTLKISSSGCSGNSWKAVLVDANEILESYPVQRNVKLALENSESCLAVFEKEFTFDITILKAGFSEVILNLEGWSTQINYN